MNGMNNNNNCSKPQNSLKAKQITKDHEKSNQTFDCVDCVIVITHSHGSARVL